MSTWLPMAFMLAAGSQSGTPIIHLELEAAYDHIVIGEKLVQHIDSHYSRINLDVHAEYRWEWMVAGVKLEYRRWGNFVEPVFVAGLHHETESFSFRAAPFIAPFVHHVEDIGIETMLGWKVNDRVAWVLETDFAVIRPQTCLGVKFSF